MGVFAVNPPQTVAALGLRTLGVPESDAAGLFRVGDVVNANPGAGLIMVGGLVGHQHRVANYREGVGPQMGVFQVGLGDELGIVDVGYVHAGDIFGRGHVGHVEDPPAVPGLVYGHALADISITVQVMVRDQLHVLYFLSGSRHYSSSRNICSPV